MEKYGPLLEGGISEIEGIIKKGAEILNLKNRPIEGFTDKIIFMEYLRLQMPSMKNDPDTVKDYFEIIEGQASWVVLREFMSEEEIAKYGYQERQNEFIEKLYKHKSEFIFFEQREKALENLNSLGIINQEYFKPVLQEPHYSTFCIL